MKYNPFLRSRFSRFMIDPLGCRCGGVADGVVVAERTVRVRCAHRCGRQARLHDAALSGDRWSWRLRELRCCGIRFVDVFNCDRFPAWGNTEAVEKNFASDTRGLCRAGKHSVVCSCRGGSTRFLRALRQPRFRGTSTQFTQKSLVGLRALAKQPVGDLFLEGTQ